MSSNQWKPINPHELNRVIWPQHKFWHRQNEIIDSVEKNDVTVVPSSNKSGKDFVAGNIIVSTFLRHRVCRIVVHSVTDDHLDVLFSEIHKFIHTARFPLTGKDAINGLKVQHRDIRKYTDYKTRTICDTSYIKGIVSKKGEGLAGHHAPWTLAVFDEASGIEDIAYTQVETWAKRILIIGNPLPCHNFFYRLVKGGDVPAVRL